MSRRHGFAASVDGPSQAGLSRSHDHALYGDSFGGGSYFCLAGCNDLLIGCDGIGQASLCRKRERADQADAYLCGIGAGNRHQCIGIGDDRLQAVSTDCHDIAQAGGNGLNAADDIRLCQRTGQRID
ncbi:hypothetical protein D3C86_1039700 [compost metagenome]